MRKPQSSHMKICIITLKKSHPPPLEKNLSIPLKRSKPWKYSQPLQKKSQPLPNTFPPVQKQFEPLPKNINPTKKNPNPLPLPPPRKYRNHH